VNGANLESGLSNETTATTGDDLPTAPQNIKGQAGDGQATLTWDNNPESDLDHYNIYQDTISGFTPATPVGTSTINSYTDTGLTNDFTYYYRISAVDLGSNESGYSQEVSVTPIEQGAGETLEAEHSCWIQSLFGHR